MQDGKLKYIFKNNIDSLGSASIGALFEGDSDRFENFSIHNDTLLFDYSKQRIDMETLEKLFECARERGLQEKRDQMFGGERINTTEDRSVLHVALRNPASQHVTTDGQDIMPEIHKELSKMKRYSDAVRGGIETGFTGKKFKTIVNIGIGGSQLGPEMVVQALEYFSDRSIDVRFVSNIDGDEIAEELQGLDPETTLFIVVSKTFTTDETMTNANSARAWIKANLGAEAVERHFAAVSTNLPEINRFGIHESRVFGFWGWVGGRYSVASAVGLSVMISIGYENFREFLNGMHTADEHFRSEHLAQNIPVIMGLIDVWNGSMLGSQSKVIAPYSHYLKRFPAYLQQLVMESNGKAVRKDGSSAVDQTSMAVFGQAGTDAQHAYFQQIHQGNVIHPVDFIGFVRARYQLPEHQRKLLSNMTAQSEALAFGKTIEEILDEGISEEVAPHKVMPGNKPSNTFLFKELSPFSLGYLIALYEHSVFVQGVMWGINSYDQWGVELGKKLAKKIEKELRLGVAVKHDSSTSGQLDYIKSNKDF